MQVPSIADAATAISATGAARARVQPYPTISSGTASTDPPAPVRPRMTPTTAPSRMPIKIVTACQRRSKGQRPGKAVQCWARTLSVAPADSRRIAIGVVVAYLAGQFDQGGAHLDLGCQRAMHRTLVGDLQQALALLFVEFAIQLDLARDFIDLAFARGAIRAVLRVDLAMR